MGAVDTDEDEILKTRNYKSSCELHRVRKVGGKKRTFDLMDCADSKPPSVKSLDEVSLYNLLVVDHLVEKRQKVLNDDYAVLRFWHERKNQFPNIFSVALRIYAIPVSSAESERVFSALQLVVNEKRSTLSSSLIDDIMVIRSLHNC